ncbi:MAG: sulfite oxidase [Rubrimonas sp.]|uniref:sulfite oxidase n=1 Tax=Rubrimonas sp. TaxID=2036015 RepID=UPI002FDD909C
MSLDHLDFDAYSPSRRRFLQGASLGALAAATGALSLPHVARASSDLLAGKDGLTLLGDRPLNAETPAHLLDDAITPTARHFIRNNGATPENRDAETWTLTIDGEVETPLTLSIADLRSRFEIVTRALVIECGGNGRAYFDPPASGNQWTVGAVGCSNWTGVRLRDVLMAAGVKPSAVYTGHFGSDTHLSGDPSKDTISRGVPIEKALHEDNLIAFAMNGEDLHPENGAPLRLVIPGWPGSVSHKWVTRIWVRDQVHDGEKMGGSSYRLPNRPVAPGEEVAREDFVIMERMPVKSVVTHPMDGAETGREIEVRGHAWSGDRWVKRVDISTDFGATWTMAELDAPVNSGAWQNWRARIVLPVAGYYEVWARATDSAGDMQPFAVAWNPRGYGNNMMHRVALRAA